MASDFYIIDLTIKFPTMISPFNNEIRFCDDHEKERSLQRHFVLLLTSCSANFILENLQEANEELGVECCAATLLENGKLFASCGVEDSELDNIICMPLLSKTTCSFLSRLLDHLVNNIKGEAEEVEDSGVLDDVSTLRISLEQLRTLKNLKCLSPTTHQAIEEHVSKIHLEKVYSKQDTSFKNSRDLVEKGKEARKEGFDGLANFRHVRLLESLIVYDVLSLKDDMEDHHSDLYEFMIKCCLWRSYSSEECMIMLWQYKSLSHAFCTSPINDVFLEAFSKHCATYNSLKYWRDCFALLKPADVGFWNNMSIISTVPSQDYNEDEAIEQARLYADGIAMQRFAVRNNFGKKLDLNL